MKKWWIGYVGRENEVTEVEVIGPRRFGGEAERVVVRFSDGTVDDVPADGLHDNEQDARRGRVLNDALAFEHMASDYDAEAADHEAKAAAQREQSAMFRARAKTLRDSVEVVS